MTKTPDLRKIVFEAISDFTVNFYEEMMKPELRQMIEDVLEEKLEQKLEQKLDQKFEKKFDEHLGPMKAAIMTLEQKVDFVIKDYAGQQLQISDYGKRITRLERKASDS